MSDIRIIEKPENITYETISNVLHEAHKKHVENGIVMRVPSMSPEQLKEWVGSKGKCFVAMDGDEVVGTASYMVRKLNRWYCRGEVAEETMLGVLPAYQGRHIASMLNKVREADIRNHGFGAIYGDTAEENTRRLQMAEKEGFIVVDYLFPNIKSKGKYFVAFMKWFEKEPFSPKYCRFRFLLKKAYVKTIYTIFGDSLYKMARLAHRK